MIEKMIFHTRVISWTCPRQKKSQNVSSKPPNAKRCRLVIKPASAMSVNQDIMTRYLEECLGAKFQFHPEDAKTVDGGRCQFTFAFQSTNQGRQAEKLLKQNIEDAGEEIEVFILKEEALVTTKTIPASCKIELQQKII